MDRNNYPQERFNVILKKRYDAWVQEGKKPLTAEELDAIYENSEQDKLADELNNTEENLPGVSTNYQGKNDWRISPFPSSIVD